MKKLITILSVAAVACILSALCFVDRIPLRAMTATRMQVLKRRVLQYAQPHGELPKSLATLPPMEGHDSSVLDGWKREIIFY